MKQPNIIFYFSDQQRWDTIGAYGQKLDVTPRLDALAAEGVVFEEAYSPQPVCGPCRALLQTGIYPTLTGCYRNNVALPLDVKTIANHFEENGYETAYVGKWHLASDGEHEKPPAIDYHHSAIPPERRGGYTGFWRVSDLLEFTSHGYDGYVFDENMNRLDFKGYRVDCITDYGLEFLNKWDGNKPFFMTISHVEPHHQNDHNHYEGPNGSKQRFADFELPGDLVALKGDAQEEYADYLGCCRSLDDNLGRLIDRLIEKGIYENTIIIYASDHGSHFRTRNNDSHKNGYDDYKRSCHSGCLHVPLIIAGPGYRGGMRVKDLVSTASLPKTFLAMAGIDAGDTMIGENLADVKDGKSPNRANEIFSQISESRVGRCIRTEDYLYSVYAPNKNGGLYPNSDVYEGDYLYDIKNDPYELNNLIDNPSYDEVKKKLNRKLVQHMLKAGETEPVIRVTYEAKRKRADL